MSTAVPPGRSGRQPALPQAPLRGGVDLGALAAAREAKKAADERAKQRAASGDAAPLVFDVTEASFQSDVIDRSMSVPVIVDLWAAWCQPCKKLSPILEKLAEADGGSWALAKIDVDAEQQLGAAFRVQSIPAVFVVMGGQAGPLFQGALPEADVRRYLDEVIKLAAAQGLPGPGAPQSGEAVPSDGVAEPEEVADPRYDAAFDAFERGDWDGADAAYDILLTDNPADLDARAGKARVALMRATDGADQDAALAAASDNPQDVAAACLAADFDLLAGQTGAAFARLIEAVRLNAGDDRDSARAHLLELFDVVGQQDPEVIKARAALASALF